MPRPLRESRLLRACTETREADLAKNSADGDEVEYPDVNSMEGPA
jgi:hypothetical protein